MTTPLKCKGAGREARERCRGMKLSKMRQPSCIRCSSCHNTNVELWRLMPMIGIQSLAELCLECIEQLSNQYGQIIREKSGV